MSSKVWTIKLIVHLTLKTISFLQDKQIKDPIRIVITGAAGQIAYSLLYPICSGDVFGKDQVSSVFFVVHIVTFSFIQSVIVHLLDITPMMGVLQGVVMEIEDMSLPLVKGKILSRLK